MAETLADKTCVPCRGGVPPLDPSAASRLLEQLDGWRVVDGRRLEKAYRFENFAQALAFVNRVGAISEAQRHHPEIALGWGKVTLDIWTHKIDGLTESDFILAAKCDREECS